MRKVILVLDALVIVASMLLAMGLHEVLREHVTALKEPPRFAQYASLVYWTIPLWLVVVVVTGLHRCFERTWTRAQLIVDLLKLHIIGLVGITVLMFVTQSVVNRSLVALMFSCTFVLFYLERGIIGRWLRYQHERGHGRQRVLLVGLPSTDMLELVADASRDSFPPEFIGYVADPTNEPASRLAPLLESDEVPEALGTLADLDRILHERAVDQVLFLPPWNQPERVGAALGACETLGVAASFWVDLDHSTRATPRLVALYERPFISFETAPKRPEALAIKHGVDVLAAAVGLVVIAPILLIVSLAILVTMGRPIFFTQARAGVFGRTFRMVKFRTMVRDAETRRGELAEDNEMDGPVFKVSGDPRVTALGRFLRRTSLDELPQLFNVVAGSMSLVGPRPLPVLEQQQIRGWQRRRLSMKPGITGLWQVSGRSNIDFEQWMKLDLLYVDSWSLALDVRILLKTIPAVLFGEGAR